MTAELARSRGLDVYESGYGIVELNDYDYENIPIDGGYWSLLDAGDSNVNGEEWRRDILGRELADILDAGLVELEGEVVEP